MADPRARPGFGQIDLEIDEAFGAPSFGELDWDPPEDGDSSIVPASDTRPAEQAKQTLRVDEGEEPDVDSTRFVVSGALDAELMAVARGETDEPPPSSRHSGQHAQPSASHVSAMGDRVAAMRDLYARGDADAALALASTLETRPPPSIRTGTSVDSPDASLYIEVGEADVDAAAFGGLIPVDDELPIEAEDPVHERDMTRIARSASLPPGPVLSSLTERQGIPRLLKSPQEISNLPIDNRAGFLLGFIDGMQTMEEILDVCAMPAGEALELIRSLVDMGVIEIE